MEVKVWEYEEYPGLTEEVEGAVHIPEMSREFTIGMIFRMQKWTVIRWCFRFWSHIPETSRKSFIHVLCLCRGLPGAYRMCIRAARIMRDWLPADMW